MSATAWGGTQLATTPKQEHPDNQTPDQETEMKHTGVAVQKGSEFVKRVATQLKELDGNQCHCMHFYQTGEMELHFVDTLKECNKHKLSELVCSLAISVQYVASSVVLVTLSTSDLNCLWFA